MQRKQYQLTLQSYQDLSPSVRHFAFTVDDPALMDYTPGQFITLCFEHEGKALKRSYSIATIPGQSDCLEIAAGFVENGPGTGLLFGLEPGDSITAIGPLGRLILGEAVPKRYIFVATSTGVTPYRSMLPSLAQQLDDHRALSVVILEGVRSPADCLYADDFLALAKTQPRFKFQAHYSRVQPDNPAQHEQSGYVQDGFDALHLNPAEDIIYLCGNPGMIDAAFAYCQDKDFDPKSVRREKYFSAKT